MKIYIVQIVWDYEGSKIIGVYNDEAKAQERRLKAIKNNKEGKYFDIDVREYELNEEIEVYEE